MMLAPVLSNGKWTCFENGLTFRLTARLRVRHDASGMHFEQAWQCLETRAVRWEAVPEDGNATSNVRDGQVLAELLGVPGGEVVADSTTGADTA